MRISTEAANQLAIATSLAFTPQHLASAAHDGTVALLDLDSLEVILLTSFQCSLWTCTASQEAMPSQAFLCAVMVFHCATRHGRFHSPSTRGRAI